MRAVKVDALRPCSAVQIQYVSIAFACASFTSPRQASRKRSAAVSPSMHLLLRHRRLVRAARRLRDDRERRGGEPPQILLRLLVVDVDELAELPLAAEAGERRLELRHVAAGAVLELAVRSRQARLEGLVDEQPPHLLERNLPDEVLDVDAAVPELAAFLVGLCDLRLEGDDAGEAWAEFSHAWISSSSISRPRSALAPRPGRAPRRRGPARPRRPTCTA